MRKWQVATVVIVVVLLTVVLAGCNTDTVATVNGKAISQKEIDDQIGNIKKQQPDAFAGEKGKKLEKGYRERLLEQLIMAELIKQEAERKKIKVSDKEVNEKFQQVRKLFGNDNKKMAEAFRKQGTDEEKYKQRIRETIISDKIVNDVVKKQTVSDSEVKDYYDKNTTQFADPAQVRVRQIQLKTEAEANKVLAEITGGADFAEKAKTASQDPATKASGGDLGFRPVDQFAPALASSIGGLKPGQVSGVVKDETGYSIVKLEESKPARQRTFDESKDQIKQKIILDKQQKVFLAWIEGLKKKAKIVKEK